MDTGAAELEEFRRQARTWLASHAGPRLGRNDAATRGWGVGSDSVEVFPNVDVAREVETTAAAAQWQRVKFDAGFGAITWEVQYGGRGLPSPYERAFRSEEKAFQTPEPSEILAVTIGLVAPTVRAHGSEELRSTVIPSLLRADAIACQLFSEPGAGSEVQGKVILAGLMLVWVCDLVVASSDAEFSDPAAPKHEGMTAFLVPLDTPGIEIRPIRQMTGGSSFNEVFLTDVRVPDRYRIGALGEGWRVALTTLGFERSTSQHTAPGGSFRRLLQLARHLDLTADPIVRQELVKAYTLTRVLDYTNQQRRAPKGRSASWHGCEA